MERRTRQETVLAACLTGLAGYVDAMGLRTLGDLFVSFMSGDSTVFASRAARGVWAQVGKPAVLIGAFVLGAALGSLIGRLAGERRPSVVLLVVAALLAAAASLHLFVLDQPAAAVMALAMGVQNGVFEGKGGVAALTYVTGTLAKVGQQLTAVLFGESPEPLFQNASLWLGLICGAVAGTWIWAALHLNGLWVAAGAALLLSGAATRLGAAKG